MSRPDSAPALYRRPLPARLLASVALGAVVLGIPVWLAAMGGMPFAHLSPHVLWAAAVDGRQVDPGAVIRWLGRVALLFAWAAWLWTVVCIVVEARSRVSGRSVVPLPASRHMQWIAACLVSTAFALGGFGRTPVHPVHPSAAPRPIRTDAPMRSVPTAVPVIDEPDGGPVRSTTPVDRTRTETRSGATPSAMATHRPTPQDPHGESTRSTPSVGPVGPAGSTTPDGAAGPATPHGADRAGEVPVMAGAASLAVPTDVVPPHHVVTGRETLWSIAGARLDSASRWKEIADLNYGRAQEDGGQLDADHWIRPGWVLALPSDAERSATCAPTPTVAPAPTDAPTPTVSPASVAKGPAGAHALMPGHTTSLPVAFDRAAGSAETVRMQRDATEPLPMSPIHRPPVVPLGAGIVGVGVVDLVDRLRRVQQRHREAGARIRLPGPLLRQFEQRLRAGDGVDELRAGEEAVRLFMAHGDPGRTQVLGVRVSSDDVQLVLASPISGDSIPMGFCQIEDQPVLIVERISLEGNGIDRSGGRRTPFPLPTLVTVGRSEHGVVMVNPEGLGSLVVDGDVHGAEGLARALALELATSRWGTLFDLVVVGFGSGLDQFDRVRVESEAGPLLADLSWRRLRDAMLLDELGHSSVAAARAAEGGGEWDPLVVVCGPGVPSSDAAALVDIGCDPRSGIGVVVVAGDGVGIRGSATHLVRVDSDSGPPTLSLFGELLVPQQVDGEDVDRVHDLLATSAVDRNGRSDPGDSEPVGETWEVTGSRNSAAGIDGIDGIDGADEGPTGPVHFARLHPDVGHAGHADPAPALLDRTVGATARIPAPTSATSPDPSTDVPSGRRDRRARSMPPVIDVEVAVLGPVEIRGAAREFTRAWARELVVYLAMHPNGTANETWATALWPERVMAPSSLHSTASVARRSLGKAKDGRDHLPRSHGRLVLSSSVGTDWDRFVDLSDGDDIDRWKAALELVRGRPFDGLRSTDWTILDGTAPEIESSIVDLSGRLAGACLRSGDARGAEWAARRGLLVSPYDERLYRMLLRAADAAGNPGGVESVMSELVRVVADEIEPVESVHPSTLALYRSLSRRRTPVS